MEHNGPGLEYKVSYRQQHVEEEWQEQMVKRHSFMVKNTPTFVPYEVKIQAKNHAGWAPEPETIVAYSGEDCKYMALFLYTHGHEFKQAGNILPVITFCHVLQNRTGL